MTNNDKITESDLLVVFAQLEESLWRAETRLDNDYMESVLAADFFEYGRSGKRYERSQMLFAPGEFTEINAKLPLSGFSARYLADGVVQTTYISEVVLDGEVQFANRSSLWTWQTDGWKLRFHQGTPTDRG